MPKRIAPYGVRFGANCLSGLSLAMVFTVAAQAAPGACEWQPIDPGNGHFTAGSYSVDLGEPDNGASPTAWQGPIVISPKTGRSCSVDPAVGIIERPLFATAMKMLVSTYSGSNKTLFIVDNASCKIAWKSEAFEGTVSLAGNHLSLGAHKLALKKSCLP